MRKKRRKVMRLSNDDMKNNATIIYFAWRTQIALWQCYTLIGSEFSCRIRWWCLKCVIVYLVLDIPVFVIYYVYGGSGSSLLIESTDYDYIAIQ